MITEDYVSFEIAKLLKEKGFDQKCEKVYMQGELKWASCCMEGESFVNREDIRLAANYENWIEYTQGDYAVLAPTLNIAMKWLREVHKIDVCVCRELDDYGGCYDGYIAVVYSNEVYMVTIRDVVKDLSYEEACEAAIKYVLKNLI